MSKCGQTCIVPTTTQAHCPTCHATFGGVTGFDAHRRRGECVDPASKGYVKVKGIWRLPMPEDELRRRRGLRPIHNAPDGPERSGGSAVYPPTVEAAS
jgi:hypothetical protein